MALKKPSDLFGKKSEENEIPIVESDNSFREELTKVESLSEQITQLQQELSQKVVQTDLEKLVLSQISSMQENFEYLQNDFRKSNKKDIAEFKERVSELTDIVGNLVENELPKYKKYVTKNEVRIGEKFDIFKNIVEENISDIKEEIDYKVNDIVEVIDNNLEYFSNQLQETSSEVKNTTNTYNKLSKIVESRISKENEQLEKYSKIVQSLHESFVELQTSIKENNNSQIQIIEERFEVISSDVKNKLDDINEDVSNFKDKVSSEVSNVKADVVINEQHIKNVDKYLQEYHQELIEIKEEVFAEIEKLPVGNLQENLERLEKKIDYIKETYSKIEPEVVVKEVIKEGLLNNPPNEKTTDPLSPLNQNFVTLDQLQQHYRLFINRIQQQLSTIGGGGETQLKYLDDIVGIATDPSSYDGKFLKYNHSLEKFEFVTVSGGGGGSGDYASVAGIATIAGYASTAGIATYASSAGIATYASTAGIATVAQNLTGSPNITVSSVNSSGVVTASAFSGSGANLTSLDATQLTSGTVPSARITASSGDFTVGQNLYVNGSLSVGGTSIILNAQQLQIADRDIVLGITTDANNNDISNDNTANHGGISIASTVGTPLINIPLQVGVNSNPFTYKQFMWIKQSNYSGMGTDAWISNYAISIGNTSSVQNGSRLTVGTGFTVFDSYLDATDIRARNINAVNNINASGIVTANSFRGDGSQLTGITAAGSGVVVQNQGSTVGTATTINFSTNLTATFSNGVATVTATGGGTATASIDLLEVMLFS